MTIFIVKSQKSKQVYPCGSDAFWQAVATSGPIV